MKASSNSYNEHIYMKNTALGGLSPNQDLLIQNY